MSRGLRRMSRILDARMRRLAMPVLVTLAAAMAHETTYRPDLAVGGDYQQAMTAGGHGGYWPLLLGALVIAVTLLGFVALRELRRLSTRARATSRTGLDDDGCRTLVRIVAPMTQRLFALTAVANVLQEPRRLRHRGRGRDPGPAARSSDRLSGPAPDPLRASVRAPSDRQEFPAMPRSSARAFMVACLLAIVVVTPASGHAALESASPGPDEAVSVVPAELVARFTQDLHGDRTSIELRDAAGQTIASGGKDPDRARVQRMALPALAAGTYEVRWVSWSAEDDELERGRYRFTVVDPVITPVPSPDVLCPSPSVAASPGASIAGPSADPALQPSIAPSAAPGQSPAPSPTLDPCAPVVPAPSASMDLVASASPQP